jgi:hypothetical protein
VSYIPLRDTFDLTQGTQGLIFALTERIDAEAQAELHKDQCGCDAGVKACKYQAGAFYQAPGEFVIAWLLREGHLRNEQLREAVR